VEENTIVAHIGSSWPLWVVKDEDLRREPESLEQKAEQLCGTSGLYHTLTNDGDDDDDEAGGLNSEGDDKDE
jgi:hypothetical protein